MFWFLIPLVFGFVLAGASAFTAAYTGWWGERGGKIATSILRNFLGIPLGYIGMVVAWLQPSPSLFTSAILSTALAWVLIVVGLIPVIWGHFALGWKTHFPSIKDPLVRDGLYGYVRHPIYAGGLLIAIGAILAKPTVTFVMACALGFVWLIAQARLEEIDLLQRIPAYRKYMEEVPRFLPWFWMPKTDAAKRPKLNRSHQ
jgi:protein-S-isoprenylcysteine O-methyltransferase Ste14